METDAPRDANASASARAEEAAQSPEQNKSKDNNANSKRKRQNDKQRKGSNGKNSDVQLSKSLSWVLRHSAPSLGLRPTPDGYFSVEDMLSLKHPRFCNKGSSHNGGRKYTVDDIRRVVESSDKQRFRLEYKDNQYLAKRMKHEKSSDRGETAATSNAEESTNAPAKLDGSSDNESNLVLCIRANQGHSFSKHIESDKLHTPLTKEELSDPNLTIVHGTTRKAWEDHIRIEGLSRMKRTHIHFATGLPTSDNKPISGMRATSQIYIYINGEKCAKDGVPFFKSDNGVILTAGVNEDGFLPVKYFRKVVMAFNDKVLLDDDDEDD